MSQTTPLQRALPNALTLARVVLAAVFVAILSATDPADARAQDRAVPLLAAAALFVVAALTDALDGHLARKWNVVSLFGRVMDPFADKLLVLGAFVLLAGPAFAAGGPAGRVQLSGVEPWMAVVILARELLVTSLRGAMESRGVDFSATLSGKLKMVLQSAAVPLILALIALGDPAQGPTRTAILATAWGTVLVTAWSGVPYVVRAIRAA